MSGQESEANPESCLIRTADFFLLGDLCFDESPGCRFHVQYMTRKQLVILAANEPSPNDQLPPLGRRGEILESLAACNTGPEQPGDDLLYGPGILIELPPAQDPVSQMLLTLTEEEIGWLVVMRLSKKFQWKIFDPESGRELTPGSPGSEKVHR